MKTHIVEALLSMGYRKVPSGYGKPIGYNFLHFNPDDMTLTNFFKSLDEEVMIFNSHKFEESDASFLDWLKHTESFTHLAIRNGSEFEFLTQQQRYEVML